MCRIQLVSPPPHCCNALPLTPIRFSLRIFTLFSSIFMITENSGRFRINFQCNQILMYIHPNIHIYYMQHSTYSISAAAMHLQLRFAVLKSRCFHRLFGVQKNFVVQSDFWQPTLDAELIVFVAVVSDRVGVWVCWSSIAGSMLFAIIYYFHSC